MRRIATLIVIALAATACGDSTTTAPEAWRMEIPLPATSWSVNSDLFMNGDPCAVEQGRIDVKDGKGEIIGTGPINTPRIVEGLPEGISSVTVEWAKEKGGECVTDTTNIPLARTAPIYVIVVKQGGAEEEIVLSDTEVEAWLHNN